MRAGHAGSRLPRAGLRAACVSGLAVLVSALGAGPADAAHGLRTGFYDIGAFQDSDAPSRAIALERTRNARASMVRILVTWREVAPVKPPDTATARNPAWPGYSWGKIDPVVRDVAGAGLQPVISQLFAPSWAEGAHRPKVSSRAPAGTWRPSPEAYGNFAEAMARRYSGSFPDPAHPGQVLPRVRYWQAWNEPNLDNYLTPQWTRHGKRFTPASPGHYRKMLNAFYAGVKSVARSNFVIGTGTAPFGQPWPGGKRMPPALFTRSLLCVSGRAHPKPAKCAGSPAHLDAIAHHPYALGSPRRAAFNPDDVVMPDFRKLSRPLRVAERSGRVLPRGRKQLWVSEFAWDSNPPDPGGSRLPLQAQYVQQGLYTLWRQGVDVAIYFLLRDSPKGRGYKYTYQGGMYFRSRAIATDKAKPALQAFRFPFSAFRHRGVAKLWGIAPAPGAVTIEARRGRQWKRLTGVRAGGNRVFFARRRVKKGTLLRARQGSEATLPFRVGPGERL